MCFISFTCIKITQTKSEIKMNANDFDLNYIDYILNKQNLIKKYKNKTLNFYFFNENRKINHNSKY